MAKAKEVTEVVEEPVVEKVTSKKCGHKNRHFINHLGERDVLLCELPEGHSGDHEADYTCYRPYDGGSIRQARDLAAGKIVPITLSRKIEAGAVLEFKYIETVERAYWGDPASVAAEEIKPDLAQLMELRKKKGEFLDEAQIRRKGG